MASETRATAPLCAPTLAGPVLGLVVAGVLSVPAWADSIIDLRFGRSVAVGPHVVDTRVVIETGSPICAQARLRADPYRLELELAGIDAPPPAALPTGLIEAVEWHPAAPRGGRLVILLKGPARLVEREPMAPADGRAWRFVYDLDRATQAEFAGARLNAALAAQAGQPCLLPAHIAAAAGVPYAGESPRAKQQAKPAPAETASPRTPRPRDGKWVIVIDPGHGGEDPGARSAAGRLEKDITLAAAQTIKRKFEATKRYRVVLTRDDDRFLSLRERVDKAEVARGNLFLSLHADSIGLGQVHGLSIYTLSAKASDAEAKALANKENKTDAIAGVELPADDPIVAYILADKTMDKNTEMARHYALAVLDRVDHVNAAEKHEDRRLRVLAGSPHRSAGFVVLKAPNVPSVLVELGYLSNALDARNLTDARYQERLAQMLIEAADSYFKMPEVQKWYSARKYLAEAEQP